MSQRWATETIWKVITHRTYSAVSQLVGYVGATTRTTRFLSQYQSVQTLDKSRDTSLCVHYPSSSNIRFRTYSDELDPLLDPAK
jgi:lipid-A-disaccharide synthase-like uncharacterized protein